MTTVMDLLTECQQIAPMETKLSLVNAEAAQQPVQTVYGENAKMPLVHKKRYAMS